jgi:signal transduction histidine kinase
MVGDAARIKQTLYHLVIAALKTATGDTVAVAAAREGNGVVLSVRYGAPAGGRPPALSLHLAQRIAELHGGSLAVAEQDGDAVVSLRLPAGGQSTRAAIS